MKSFHTLDVFTNSPYSGNPLAVVRDADDLSTAQMQTIAREFNLSETIFVRTPADPSHTAEVRIFFPTAEIPFAGHPTVGCSILLAEEAMGDGDWETLITLEEQAGLVPVTVTRKAGTTRAMFVAPVIPHASADKTPKSEDIAALAQPALGLPQVGFGDHKPAVWSGGPTFLYIPVPDLSALADARPLEPGWSAMMDACGVDSAYLYTAVEGGYQARMFSPTAGIPEDPATGSASAILTAQLLASGALADGRNDIALHQGIEMGRPSRIELSADIAQGAIQQVRIAGTAVHISSGTIQPPATK